MDTLFQTLAFIGALTIVIVAAFFWAKVIRKKAKRRYEYPKPSGTDSRKGSNQFSSGGKKQKRRRRRSQPPTNPTLAQTRGLPPVREDHRAVAEHYQN